MKVNTYIRDNLLIPYQTEDVDKIDSLPKEAIYVVEIGKGDQRSIKQNSALHRYFSLVSIELNKRGHVIDPKGLNVEWSPTRVKELIWRKFQKVVLNKESTRLLTKVELTQIYDYVNLYIGENFGFHVEFPNKEQLDEITKQDKEK